LLVNYVSLSFLSNHEQVIYNVTLGIRTAAQLAQNAAASDVASGGIANGSVWVAEANARARIIDIDPLHQAAGGEGGGVKFEALIDMVRAYTCPLIFARSNITYSDRNLSTCYIVKLLCLFIHHGEYLQVFTYISPFLLPSLICR
jgi:hypothetical protein